MALTVDQIVQSFTDAGITDTATLTKMLGWAKHNLDRQTEEYAMSKCKTDQTIAIALANDSIATHQRNMDAIDAALTELLS